MPVNEAVEQIQSRPVSLRRMVEQVYEECPKRRLLLFAEYGSGGSRSAGCHARDVSKLYVALRDGEEIRSARGWVFRVAHNLGLKGREKRSRLRPIDGEFSESVSASDDPERNIIDAQRRQIIDAAIRELSPQQRQCLHLRAEGLRYHEIASTIGISISSVAVFLRRAVSKLRKVADA